MKLEPHNGYIEKVENISFDIASLYNEYTEIIEPNLIQRDNNHYKEIRCIWENKELPILAQCEETKKAINIVSQFFSFNAVIWRQLDPMRAYQWHTDEGKINYHIPVFTNLGCWFVYAGKSFQILADGSIYKVNNHHYHTFVNAGHKPRVHLLFENYGTTFANIKAETNLKNFFSKRKS